MSYPAWRNAIFLCSMASCKHCSSSSAERALALDTLCIACLQHHHHQRLFTFHIMQQTLIPPLCYRDITYNVCGGMLNLTQPQPRSPVFANFDPICLLRRLQSVLNAGARLIFQLRRSDHITDALVSLHWVGCISQLEERRSLAGELTLSCTRPSEDG